MYSFGLALFVDLGMISLHGWEPVQCLGKSMCEIFNEDKVSCMIENIGISMIEAVSGLQIEFREAKSRADAQC